MSERHQHRALRVNSLVDGETRAARNHHAIVKDGFVVSELLPSGSLHHVSEKALEKRIEEGGDKLRGAAVTFIPHEEPYTRKGPRGGIKHFIHGKNDGLSNSIKYDPSASDSSWIEGGSRFQGMDPRRHDSNVTPYQDPTYK